MPAPFVLAGYAVLAALMLAAVCIDLRTRRIPNRLVASGVGLALALHVAAMATSTPPIAGSAWWAPLAGFAAGLAVLMPLYLLRAMGAGDVKLMAMTGAFIGAHAVLAAAIYTLVAGGLLSLAFMMRRRVAVQTITNLRFMLFEQVVRAASGQGVQVVPLQVTAARLPYAVAIALGVAASAIWPLTRLWGMP
jgi:prepilin peptidase CpaA